MKETILYYELQAASLLDRLHGALPLYEAFVPNKVRESRYAQEILDGPEELRVAAVREILTRIAEHAEGIKSEMAAMNLSRAGGFPVAATSLLSLILRKSLRFSDPDRALIIDCLNRVPGIAFCLFNLPFLPRVVLLFEEWYSMPPAEEIRTKLQEFSRRLQVCGRADERKLSDRILRMLRTKHSIPLESGEAWADAAIAALLALPETRKQGWIELLQHCRDASAAKPSEKWTGRARELLETIGEHHFKSAVKDWFALVDKPRTQRIESWPEYVPDPNLLIIEPHSDMLKGLAWCCSVFEDAEIARAISGLALSAYRKVPQIGPRAVKVGNACILSLGRMSGMDGLAQLGILKARVKFGTCQKQIEKAYLATAERLKIPRDELEEMAVPTYGMEEVGKRVEQLGEVRGELVIEGSAAGLKWFGKDGKPRASVPAAVKKDFAEELKELKGAAKDIERMLGAQKERLDSLFLKEKKWRYEVWRERYLDHPLVGTLARRLIWKFEKDGKVVDGILHEDELIDMDGRAVSAAEGATVSLWHPIGRSHEEIVGWRGWLEENGVQQPFKQAHREVYILTEAERRTRTYSNRFAAHVLKQHQFNALCGLRGWKNQLRLLVDADYAAPHRVLPNWGLRAEFWVEGIGDDYGSDTNESGVFLYLSTDQVRFYRVEAPQRSAHAGGGGYHPPFRQEEQEPLPMEEIPPLVFSEIMRDVDLFVGVASVGNDPTWADGGPAGRYQGYWNEYSFGALGATAKTRKEVLERLVPRLKIAERCSFSEKFLVVKGNLRTYKIHLGSGNILMEPNDEYLCIVPRSAGTAGKDEVLLPFEGDRTMSVILSKAFMLAEDEKIRDETIVRQIRG